MLGNTHTVRVLSQSSVPEMLDSAKPPLSGAVNGLRDLNRGQLEWEVGPFILVYRLGRVALFKIQLILQPCLSRFSMGYTHMYTHIYIQYKHKRKLILATVRLLHTAE